MSRKGGYIGGSTIIRAGSDWFSYTNPKGSPTTGETRADQIKRVQAEVAKAKELKKKKQENGKKAGKPLITPKERARQIEERRLAKIERRRARLAEQRFIGPQMPSPGALKQQERLSRLVVEKRTKKKLLPPKPSTEASKTRETSS